MKFGVITREEFDKYFNGSKYSHFMQTSSWGEVSKVRNQTPVYVGLKDGKKIVAAALLLKRSMPLGYCYFYACKGFCLDYSNEKIFHEFTVGIKQFLKDNKAVNLIVDPEIMYQEIDANAQAVDGGKNNYPIYNMFVKEGYKHQGFTRLYELRQPRFTFRIDTTVSMEEIESKMNKTFLKTVKRSYNYDLEVLDSYDTDTFYKLLKDIAAKDNFTGNPIKFYDELDKNMVKSNNMHYVTIKIYPSKLLKKAKDELKDVKEKIENSPAKHLADLQNQQTRLEKDIEMFEKYKDHKDGLISLILICPKTKNQMWTLYIGNNDLAEYTFAVPRAYYEAIKYAHDNDFEFLDLFGTMGDPNFKIRNSASIHEFKRKMGGEYIELIGEFILVNKPILYFIIPRVTKLLHKIKKVIKRK